MISPAPFSLADRRGPARPVDPPSRALAWLALALLGFFAPACRGDGAPAGAPCTRASDCAERFCLAREGADGGVLERRCARTCRTSTDCTGDEVCGRFSFRSPPAETDGGDTTDAAVFSLDADDTEVVRVCRPRSTQPCGPGLAACPAGQGCLGAPQGVCATLCSSSRECATRLCLRTRCDAPGYCAARCDEALECPRQFYCDPSSIDFARSGRCLPFDEGDSGYVTCPSSDAGTDAAGP